MSEDALMTAERLKAWLEALEMPKVIEIKATAIPETFFVTFEGHVMQEKMSQLELVGLFSRYDGSDYIRARYLIQYKGAK